MKVVIPVLIVDALGWMVRRESKLGIFGVPFPPPSNLFFPFFSGAVAVFVEVGGDVGPHDSLPPSSRSLPSRETLS